MGDGGVADRLGEMTGERDVTDQANLRVVDVTPVSLKGETGDREWCSDRMPTTDHPEPSIVG
jgi:hypothetical protein